MTLPDDLDPDYPYDIMGWPQGARQSYYKSYWSRAELVAVLLNTTGSLEEERIEDLRNGNTRLTKDELAHILTELQDAWQRAREAETDAEE